MKISQILPKESGSERKKNDTQQEYVWHSNTQPEGVPELKIGALKATTDRRAINTTAMFDNDQRQIADAGALRTIINAQNLTTREKNRWRR